MGVHVRKLVSIHRCYWGTSLIRKCLNLRSYNRFMPKTLRKSLGGGGRVFS
jgi:hypothetical protein